MKLIIISLFTVLIVSCGSQSAGTSSSIIGTWKRDCFDNKILVATFAEGGAYSFEKYLFENEACEGASKLVNQGAGTYFVASTTITEEPQPLDITLGSTTYALVRLIEGKLQISDTGTEDLSKTGATPDSRLTSFGSRFYLKQ